MEKIQKIVNQFTIAHVWSLRSTRYTKYYTQFIKKYPNYFDEVDKTRLVWSVLIELNFD